MFELQGIYNVCHRHIHTLSFRTVKNKKSTNFMLGYGL